MTVSFPLTIGKLRARLLNLKRLNNLPLPTRLNYVITALFGELFKRRTFGAMSLRLVEINLTRRCQCRCRHCYAESETGDKDGDELSTARIQSLLHNIKKLGAVEVIFTGGEPLLRDDLLELVACAHRLRLVVRLITNGILLNEKMVRNLKKAGLSWCSISIDSPNPGKHDAFRGYPGCFDRAMEGFCSLKRHRIPCSIISVARKELVYSGDLEKIVEMGRNIGVTLVRINFPVPMGRYCNDPGQVLNFAEREKVRELMKSGFVTMESPDEKTRCTAAVTKINILPNGDVTPCVFIPLTLGNIREGSLEYIWKSTKNSVKEFAIKGRCPMCDPVQRQKLLKMEEIKNGVRQPKAF